tara:strand:+ start:131 stop:421 length:291 start_codon:yes stop_codon:yes gene_type:complete
MQVEEYRKIHIQKYGKETIKDIQENWLVYLNEYVSGCRDGTFKEPEYNLEDELENEMKNDFYDDDYLDAEEINHLNTFTDNLINGKRRYENKKNNK